MIEAAPVEEILRMIAELRPSHYQRQREPAHVCKINRHEECVLAQLAERTHTITPAQEPSGVPVFAGATLLAQSTSVPALAQDEAKPGVTDAQSAPNVGAANAIPLS
ncbi:MAG: hypothetical protein WCD75_08640, partial [Rhodoplanes sp.]